MSLHDDILWKSAEERKAAGPRCKNIDEMNRKRQTTEATKPARNSERKIRKDFL